MSLLEQLSSHPVTRELGWFLFHLTWTALVVGGLLWVVLAMLRSASAEARYRAVLGAMLLTLAVPVALRLWALAAGGSVHGLLAAPVAGAAPAAAWSPGWPSSWWVPWGASVEGALPVLAVLWILGVQLWLARAAYQWLCARRLRRHGARPAGEPLRRRVATLARELGVRASVRVVESTLARVPAVVGWLEPVLLVPVGLVANMPPHQLRAILAHELAHVRRHDYLVALFQALFEALLFFHPLAWWMSSRLSEEREYCCDDVAVKLCGDRLAFAQALSSLDELRSGPSALSLASNGGPLMKRILRLVAPVGHGRRPSDRLGQAAVTLLLLVFLAPLAVGLASGSQGGGIGRRAPAADRAPQQAGPADELRRLEREIERLDRRIAELRRELASMGDGPSPSPSPRRGAGSRAQGRAGAPRADAPDPIRAPARTGASRAPRADGPDPVRTRSRGGIRTPQGGSGLRRGRAGTDAPPDGRRARGGASGGTRDGARDGARGGVRDPRQPGARGGGFGAGANRGRGGARGDAAPEPRSRAPRATTGRGGPGPPAGVRGRGRSAPGAGAQDPSGTVPEPVRDPYRRWGAGVGVPDAPDPVSAPRPATRPAPSAGSRYRDAWAAPEADGPEPVPPTRTRRYLRGAETPPEPAEPRVPDEPARSSAPRWRQIDGARPWGIDGARPWGIDDARPWGIDDARPWGIDGVQPPPQPDAPSPPAEPAPEPPAPWPAGVPAAREAPAADPVPPGRRDRWRAFAPWRARSTDGAGTPAPEAPPPSGGAR